MKRSRTTMSFALTLAATVVTIAAGVMSPASAQQRQDRATPAPHHTTHAHHRKLSAQPVRLRAHTACGPRGSNGLRQCATIAPLSPADLDTAARLRRSARGRVTPDLTPGPNPHYPTNCSITANGLQSPDRFTACLNFTTVHTVEDQDKNVVGSITMYTYMYWETAYNSMTVVHGYQTYVGPGDGFYATGANIDVSDPNCPIYQIHVPVTCSYSDQDNEALATGAKLGDVFSDEYFETYSSSDPVISSINLFANLQISVFPTNAPPNTIPGTPLSIPPNQSVNPFRCDTLGTSSGCINPNFDPTVVFDTAVNPAVTPVAHHMAAAQSALAGHPGRPGSGTPLTRITTQSDIDTNRRLACARFVPDPPANTSCDEYPFASTRQGGSGSSIAAVPETANDSQGGILQGGYNRFHIIDGDDYYVSVVLHDARTGSVVPDSALNSTFNSYSDNATCSQWSGGDATNSVPLPDGQRAWFFSDSDLGNPGDRKTFFFTSYVHNSIVVQNGSSLRTMTGGNTCKERDTSIDFFSRYAKTIAPAPDSGFYWTGDQQLIGSNVVKFYYHGYATGNLFQNDYAAVASIPASSLESGTTLSVTPKRLSCAISPAVLWGTMTLNWAAKDGYIYVYGTSADTPHHLYLARTTAANLTDFTQWSFFTSANSNGTANWSSSCTSAQPLPIGDATGGSVNYINGTVWLVQDDYSPGSVTVGTIAAHPSNTPWGFTSRRIDLYTPPESHYDYPDYYLLYEPRLQYGLAGTSQSSSIVLTYNVNTASVDTGCAAASVYDASLYRPRFVDVPRSWFNNYDAPQARVANRAQPTAATTAMPRVPAGASGADYRPVHANPRVDPGPAALTALTARRGAGLPRSNASPASPASGIAGITDWYQHFGQPCPSIGQPPNFAVSGQPDGYANLTWSRIGTDVWYYVFSCDASAHSCASVANCASPPSGFGRELGGLWLTVNGVGLLAVDSSAKQGHTFTYYICSSGAQNPNPIGTGGNGASSPEKSAKITIAAPKAPTNVKASRSGASLTVSWSQVTYPSTSVFYTVSYQDTTTGAGYIATQPTTGLSTKLTLPSSTHKYNIMVKASNIGGYSPASSVVKV